jgi:hypothetical protein
MIALFGWLSELWLKFAEKINGAIFSFVFFWGTLAFVYHFENKIYNHLDHLHRATGNGGYYALQIVVFLVSCVVDFLWFIAPFSATSLIIHGNNVD